LTPAVSEFFALIDLFRKKLNIASFCVCCH
jgi:hypothetical protein